jgi:DNA repair protein RecO (recombination protein O)
LPGVARVARRAARRVTTDALVVRSIPYGESDVVATLLGEREGKVAAIVRGARKGSKRTFGALEPMHTVSATYEDKGTELVTLKEARVVRARMGLLGRLEAIEAAGTLLRWARHVFPPKTPEPDAFAVLIEALDALDASGEDAGGVLAGAGLRLLAGVGWGLELAQCVKCGRPCPETSSAQLDPARGGIVCRSCGGARLLLPAAVRRACLAALAGEPGASAAIAPHAKAVAAIVAAAMAAHTGYERA